MSIKPQGGQEVAVGKAGDGKEADTKCFDCRCYVRGGEADRARCIGRMDYT